MVKQTQTDIFPTTDFNSDWSGEGGNDVDDGLEIIGVIILVQWFVNVSLSIQTVGLCQTSDKFSLNQDNYEDDILNQEHLLFV